MKRMETYALHDAVASADLTRVTRLLREGSDVNQSLPTLPPFHGRSPLHVCVAAYSSSVETFDTARMVALTQICVQLLTSGAALDRRDAQGTLPSASGAHMPRPLADALRRLAFENIGVFEPDVVSDPGDYEWLMPSEALREDPLSGARDPKRYASARAAATTLRR